MTSFRNIYNALAVTTGLCACNAQADTLHLGSADGVPATTITIPVGVTTNHAIVGVQFELRYPESHLQTAPASVQGDSDHEIWSGDITNGVQRLVLYSRSNAAFATNLTLNLSGVLSSNSPAGGPSLMIQNVIFVDRLGNDFAASVTYTALESWRQQHFSLAGRDAADVIGDDRDPDGDGQANIIEAATGGDPGAGDSASTFVGHPSVNGAGEIALTLRFLRTQHAGILSEVVFTGESGVDLAQWATNGVVISATGTATNNADEMEASVTSSNRVRYLRVRVNRASSP